MLILHQAGHNSVWNSKSFKNGCGDGLIVSPVHCGVGKVRNFDDQLKSMSYFDPQFYVPDSQKANLNSYSFFPEKMTGGFSTTDFVARAYDAAAECADFQIENGFRGLIIPARYYDEMITDYIDKQRAFSVEPFLSYIEKNNIDADVFLSLPLTSAMIGDKRYRLQLLNWITSYPEITGVYLLPNFDEPLKQVGDFKKLVDYYDFISELSRADLRTICGYCNTEAILWAIAAPYAVTMGAYENTRRFSIDKFLDDESDIRGPAPRIYFPKLLNWVRYSTAMEIREDAPELWQIIYTKTDVLEQFIESSAQPHFTKPELYQHHFELIHKQLMKIAAIPDVKGRVALVDKWIKQANKLYELVQQEGILFSDNNCRGEHLPVWNRLTRRISQQQ